MTFKKAIASYFCKCAVFRGRSSRSEYWWPELLQQSGWLALLPISFMSANLYLPEWTIILWAFAVFAIGIPKFAVFVRRLHDLDLTGWWLLLLFFIALIANLAGKWGETDEVATLSVILYLAVFFGWLWVVCVRGTKGDNRFGPDPLASATTSDASVPVTQS